ncbi:MAG: amidophosphoribosyltransferase, partial [Planctomycetaceae bacterium]
MCGIVGLLIKRIELRSQLGALICPMIDCMGTRGPDSAGLAVFRAPVASDQMRFALFATDAKFDWDELSTSVADYGDVNCRIESIERHAALVSSIAVDGFLDWIGATHPKVHVLSVGRSIDVYKDEGHPRAIARRYQFAELQGTHAVAHTRMATESSVSPQHAHPFTAGQDFCLVHNGSLSNPYSIRRKLEKLGIEFETDNDT